MAMREYARISPNFWIKGSARRLRGDHHAQLVALYLATCPTASMVGIFYLPLPTICHETSLPLDEVRRCLGRCGEAEFAFYDEQAEIVWVPNMARYQIGERIGAGETNKRSGIVNAIRAYEYHRFYREFLNAYDEPYGLGLLGASGVHLSASPGAGQVPASTSSAPDLLPAGTPCARARSLSLSPVPDLDQGGPGGTHPLRDDFVLTDERRAYAKMAPVTDIDDVFKKFCGIAVEKQWRFDDRGWDSRWKRFCDDEKNYQSRIRDRRRGSVGVIQTAATDGSGWRVPRAVNADPDPEEQSK